MNSLSDDDLDPACSLGEHQFCSGNIDLSLGPGPAVPLQRCACTCHRGRVTVKIASEVRKGR